MDCLGCKSSEKDPAYITRTSHWKVFLHPEQTYLGRSVITLKRHCGSLSAVTKEEWVDFIRLVKKIESSYKKALGATLFNWSCLMNNAYQDTPPNPHVHWHLRPRYRKSVRLFGTVFEDIEFGHHYASGSEKSYMAPEEIQQQIISLIQKFLIL